MRISIRVPFAAIVCLTLGFADTVAQAQSGNAADIPQSFQWYYAYPPAGLRFWSRGGPGWIERYPDGRQNSFEVLRSYTVIGAQYAGACRGTLLRKLAGATQEPVTEVFVPNRQCVPQNLIFRMVDQPTSNWTVAGRMEQISYGAALERPAGFGGWQAIANIARCVVWTRNPSSRLVATWSGVCIAGKAEGAGTLIYREIGKPPLLRFDGTIAGGKLQGRGTLVWADGDRYEGAFESGVAEGFGTLTKADGMVFSGPWSGGCFNYSNKKAWVGVTERDCGFRN